MPCVEATLNPNPYPQTWAMGRWILLGRAIERPRRAPHKRKVTTTRKIHPIKRKKGTNGDSFLNALTPVALHCSQCRSLSFFCRALGFPCLSGRAILVVSMSMHGCPFRDNCCLLSTRYVFFWLRHDSALRPDDFFLFSCRPVSNWWYRHTPEPWSSPTVVVSKQCVRPRPICRNAETCLMLTILCFLFEGFDSLAIWYYGIFDWPNGPRSFFRPWVWWWKRGRRRER